jgi:F-type H+-transporting ATPase subunit delta
MAELATLARPYAEALFKSATAAESAALIEQANALAVVAASAQLRRYADDPKVNDKQVHELFSAVLKSPLHAKAANLLRTVIANGRLAALPEIAAQFNALVKSRSGVSDATVYSAFAIDAAQLEGVKSTLEKRFGRKLNVSMQIDSSLIGGIRVVVGDEVLDTSVRARLEKMKAALSA